MVTLFMKTLNFLSAADEKIKEINKNNENKIDKNISLYKGNILKCDEKEKKYYKEIKEIENKIIVNKNVLMKEILVSQVKKIII
jgi:hypothetical protein